MSYLKQFILGIGVFLILFTQPTYGEIKCSDDKEGCISSKEFMIKTSHFSPNGNSETVSKSGGSTEKIVNNILADFIKKLLIVFGAFSLLVMTIGGGFMIFHLGDETLLSKGKTVFMRGLLSLAVALSAGIMVNLVTYILY